MKNRRGTLSSSRPPSNERAKCVKINDK
jgi:hypothetical protein